MHADMTAVTIQLNKIISNEVKDNQALLEPSYKKELNEHFGQSSIMYYIWWDVMFIINMLVAICDKG